MQDNLRLAFPDMPAGEMQQVIREVYRNLMDVALETIKQFTTPVSIIQQRMVVRNPELINQFLSDGRSVILTGSHLMNWEWSGLVLPGSLVTPLVGSYKPLSNRFLNTYLNMQRSKGGLVLVSMEDTFSVIRKNRDQPNAYMLLSDQSPSSRKSAHWVPFFGVETAFTPGMDILSRKFNHAVVYYRIQRLQRGRYEIVYSLLANQAADESAESITKAFASLLEQDIRAQPEGWLWSHRRWKLKPN
ncbi:MAG: lysophospholipid acyltransferase family protein [Lewinellaceae bacterium]|nr:lysophospholipid acyltransferase family protein [Lewinellaceae bacterium]